MNNSPFPPGSSLVAYLRDSGHETQELSLEQQEAELLSWCREHSYILTKIYKDTGTGTSTAGRDQFKEMIHHLRSDKRQEAGLVVWKWNRFSRNIDESQFYRADLRRRGVLLYSLNDDIPSGPEGRFFEAAIDWMNQSYIEDLRADTKRGLRNLVLNYGCVPGTPPRGFMREEVEISTHRDGVLHTGHRWIPDPDLIPLVKKAWEMRACKATYKEIADETQLFGPKSSYVQFFRNPLYIGRLEYGDDIVIEEYCEPIISQEIWGAVQQINKKNIREFKDRKQPGKKGSGFILSGIAFCAKCGAPLQASVHHSKGRRYHYYRCSRGHRRWDCDAPPIPRKILEDAVKSELLGYLTAPESIAQLIRTQNEELERGKKELISRRNALSAKLGGINRKITNIINAIAEIGHNKDLSDKLTDLNYQKSQVEVLISELDNKLRPAPDLDGVQIERLTSAIQKAIRAAPQRELKKIYQGMVEKILAARDGENKVQGQITFYLPPETDSPAEGGEVCALGLYPGWSSNLKRKLALSVTFSVPY